ncbi:MAG: SufS family cysteine desulfurase [Clostridia bacterium]|nr:SufS family cysteine desulfurase [Clostridia bacterium]
MHESPDIIRKDFPFFSHNPGLVYLDNSATSQVPACVIQRLNRYDLLEKASPFRGLYPRSVQATDDYEHARDLVRDFIHASSSQEIIFTRNATESINLVARCASEAFIHSGDEILVSVAEHHSNLLPWQQLAGRTGARLRFLLCSEEGRFHEEDFEEALTDRTRLVAFTHMSNVFGQINDLRSLAQAAHRRHALVLADGCQSVPHVPVNVTELNVDFLAFSGHKMLCPMGIGVLYGKQDLLDAMPPFLTGGEMTEEVTTAEAVWAPLPQKFEAGTVNTGGAIALGEAISYYNRVGFEWMMAREAALTRRLMDGILSVPHVQIIGSPEPEQHHGIVAFTVDGVHPHDVAAIMAEQGIAIRAGHHCAQPLHTHLGLSATSRVSLMFYNTENEIDAFLNVLSEIRGAMGYAD